MAKGYRFTAKEELEMLAKGYVKEYVETEWDMVAKRNGYKLMGVSCRMSHEYNRNTKEYTFLLYVKSGEVVTERVEALKKDYKEVLRQSIYRVLPRVKQIVKDSGYTMFIPVSSAKVLKQGNLGYVNVTRQQMVISTDLLALDNTDHIDEVVAHELFHCVNQSNGHDKVWKEVTQTYNRLHNANILTYSNEIMVRSGLIKQVGLVAKCDKCNHHNIWKRTCDSYKRAQRGSLHCSCGGTFQVL